MYTFTAWLRLFVILTDTSAAGCGPVLTSTCRPPQAETETDITSAKDIARIRIIPPQDSGMGLQEACLIPCPVSSIGLPFPCACHRDTETQKTINL
jgi:hypothetical protein